MRSEIAKELRRKVELGMRERLPQFARARREEPSGNRLYKCEKESLCLYVHLIISNYWDEFSVECAWTRHGHFPSDIAPLPATSPTDPPLNGAMRVPLEYLRAGLATPKRERWWALTDRPRLDGTGVDTTRAEPFSVVLSRLDVSLEQLFSDLETWALPYFEQVMIRESGAITHPPDEK